MNLALGFSAGTVYFAGAGPGDVDLLTIKARRLIECAQCILYAGSLINPEILELAGTNADTFDTSQMKLEEQVRLMAGAAKAGKIVARLHSGDPSLYGAIHEQMQALRRENVPFAVIPGVSAAFAAAASLGIEYTLPEITQTVIFTRVGGRTPLPQRERLSHLARSHSSLVIFLSMGQVRDVTEELLAAEYASDTPAAVVYRASWPDEQVIRTTIADLAEQVESRNLKHQGLIVVAPALQGADVPRSYLYQGYVDQISRRDGTAILALSAPGVNLGRRLQNSLPQAHLYIPGRFLLEEEHKRADVFGYDVPVSRVMREVFGRYQEMICIMATGIVVRALASELESKHSDAAVVVVDANGRYVVSLLSGHTGGANRLAHKIAGITEGQAIITTASDQQDLPALDILAGESHWKQNQRSRYTKVMASFVNDQAVALVVDTGFKAPPEMYNLPWAEQFSTWEEAVSVGYTRLVALTWRAVPDSLWQSAPDSVVYHPPVLALGVGCKRETTAEEIIVAARSTLEKGGLAIESVWCVATIVDKADEPGLLGACRTMNWDLRVFTHDQISQVGDLPNPSGYVMDRLGVGGVAEPAALLAAQTKALLIEKQKYAHVTVAVAVKGDAG